MQVGLVNDGPVGVNYRSEDGAVNLNIRTPISSSTAIANRHIRSF